MEHIRIENYNAKYVRKERSGLIGPFRCRNKNARLHIWIRRVGREWGQERPTAKSLKKMEETDLHAKKRFAWQVIHFAMKSLWAERPTQEFSACGYKWKIEKVTALAYRTQLH